MDRITRDQTIKALREQFELCRLRAAWLDNDAHSRSEMPQTVSFKKRRDGDDTQRTTPDPTARDFPYLNHRELPYY